MPTNSKEYMKKYRQKNKERIKKYQKEYLKEHYKKNKEEYFTKAKKWQKENPDKRKVINKKRREVHREKYKIRNATYKKYGKLPDGFQYHHFTEPYLIDMWVGIHGSEHHKLDKIWRVI